MLRQNNISKHTPVILKAILSALFVVLLTCLLSVAFAKDPEAGKALKLDKQAKLDVLKELEPRAIMWDGLMPEGYIPDPQIFLFELGPDPTSLTSALDNTPIVESLDGQQISIPGFAVPLAGDAEMVTEFLLVPYFGACIHTPPPPANQMIHITPKYPLLQDESWDAITVVGTLSAIGVTSEYGAASYSMTDAILIPYVYEDQTISEEQDSQ